MQGYFIRIGDKTSCGGTITGGNPYDTIEGIPQSRHSDSVTCGVTGGTYQIVGGVSWIHSDGLPVAGTLSSRSGCPCNASLYSSYPHALYEAAHPQPPLPVHAITTGQTASLASAGTSAAPGPCSTRFRLVDQHALPCASQAYALMRDGHWLEQHRLDAEGRSQICSSPRLTHLQIATTAPSPVLE